MFRLLIGIMAAAWAFAGWRNAPRLDHPQSSAFGFMVAAAIVAAYWIGRKHKAAQAVAVATAHAEATAMAMVASRNENNSSAQVNVALVLDPNVGARRVGGATGLQYAPWLAGAEVDQQQLVNEETDYNESVLSEFTEEHEAEF